MKKLVFLLSVSLIAGSICSAQPEDEGSVDEAAHQKAVDAGKEREELIERFKNSCTPFLNTDISIRSKKYNDYYKFKACSAGAMGVHEMGATGVDLKEALKGQALLINTIQELTELINSGHNPKRANIGGEVLAIGELLQLFREAQALLYTNLDAAVIFFSGFSSKPKDIMQQALINRNHDIDRAYKALRNVQRKRYGLREEN